MILQNILSDNKSHTSADDSVPAVNYHLWEPCNMRCKFCFATFQDVKNSILPKGHLPKEESINVVRELANFGFEKITFVGGEPTLCPWLPDLMKEAKNLGLNTGIVTNASRISTENLSGWREHLDWIGISVDSINTETNISIGRSITGKKALDKDYYYNVVDLINSYGYKLKINTVVNQHNKLEDLSEFIKYSGTTRWKVFQVLPIKGENDLHIESLKITDKEFENFLNRHNSVAELMVPESNEKMKGSYAMVDPAGRFFENSSGKIKYSDKILDVGAGKAYKQAHPSSKKFIERGGEYNW